MFKFIYVKFRKMDCCLLVQRSVYKIHFSNIFRNMLNSLYNSCHSKKDNLKLILYD